MQLEVGSALGVVLLVVAGILAGFMNTVAGAGSLLTLPVLLLLGLPADLANGTNRVAILAQNAAGALGFDRAGRLDRPAVVRVVAPTLLGSLGGALAATAVPAPTLEPILVGSLLLVAVTLVYRPRWLSPHAEDARATTMRPGPRDMLGLFLVGVYGGFIQAGVGIFLLALLGGALRYDLVRANALKVVVVGALTVVALAVFVVRGQVVWLPGLVLAAGTVTGARLGVRFALSVPERTLRAVVFAAVVAASVGALLR
jgi:uncharacterized protein